MVGGRRPAGSCHTTTPLILLFFFLLLVPPHTAQTLTVQTRFFNSSAIFEQRTLQNSETDLAILGDATTNNIAFQLTPDTSNGSNNYFFGNKSGRVLYKQPFKLWEDAPQPAGEASSTSTRRRVASFNTFFNINIFRKPEWDLSGEGMAFVILPNLTGPPPGSYGGYLGLANASTDGNPSNRFVAVELDTFRQPYDPDDNHMSIDINTVKNSTMAVPLNKSGINIPLNPNTAFTVWIDYDGGSRRMRAYMAESVFSKPNSPVLEYTIDLSDYVAQQSYFGFAASTGTTYELHAVLSWKLEVEVLQEDPKAGKDNKDVVGWMLKAGLPVFAGLLTLSGVAWFIYVCKKGQKGHPHLGGALRSLPGMPREYRYAELKKATGNFDERAKLGQGGYGTVYRGKLPGEEAEVAVKTFSRETTQANDFMSELTIINRLRHRHLVRLLGWCYKNKRLLLIYEFMPNGSLDKHLYNSVAEQPLSWYLRYKILGGVASALHYLHNEYDQKVVHRDLKASNIMLDADFNARLGDFGLARAIDNDRTSYAELDVDGIPGTWGYIAPECLLTGKATRESDVFGFGAVILEVVCGHRPVVEGNRQGLLANCVWKLHREGRILEAVDGRLGTNYVRDEAQRLLLLGLACSHPISSERPKAEAIVQIISKSVPPPDVPLSKPAFVWPTDMSDIGTTTSQNDATRATNNTSTRSSIYRYASSFWCESQEVEHNGEHQPISSHKSIMYH